MTARFGYDKNGKEIRHEKTITASSKSEAQQKLRLWLDNLGKVNINDSEVSLKAFAEFWLSKQMHLKKLSPRTLDSYKRLLNGHIYPCLGKMKLQDMSPIILTEYFDKLSSEKINIKQRRADNKQLSPITIKGIFYLLNQIMRAAFKWDKIASNPMLKLDTPRGKPRQPAVFSLETIKSVFAALEKETSNFKLMVLLALTTGCREGELLGLSWDDYNKANATLFIHQTVQYTVARGTYIYPNTKTSNSKRKIFIIPQLIDMLVNAHNDFITIKEMAGKNWNKENLIFYKPEGTPIRPNYLSNQFTKFIKRHKIKHIRFHDLRGYFATQLMQAGYPLPDIIKRTGHSKASTLLDYYGHALTENNNAINESIETSFNQIDSSVKKLNT